MDAFLKLVAAFGSGVASFFDLEVPYLGISFLTLFGGLLVLKAIIVGIKIIFGTDHGGDSE